MANENNNTVVPQTAPLLTGTVAFRFGAIVLLAAFVVIYALTLDTGLQPYELHGGDLITHQYAQVQARPSNAPGYPLYTMGGWLWFHGWRWLLTWLGQPLPNPIQILSSYSTLWAFVALALLYAVTGHLVGKSRQPWLATLFCLLLTAFFGVTYFFWYYATTTEQYSSAVAQTLAIIYLYLKWDKDPKQRSLVYWLAFLCGLSLAHMLTVAFIVPPLVAVMIWRDPSLLRSPRTMAIAIMAALLPLASYIYVYLRGALHPGWWGRGYWPTPQAWFWSFVSTSQGRDELAWAFEPGRPFLGNGFPEMIWQELSLPLLTLGIAGLFLLPRRHTVIFVGTLAIYTIFCWIYRFGNWFQVMIPVYPIILIGLVPFFKLAHDKQSRNAALTSGLLIAAMAAALVWRVQASLPATDSRHRAEDTALDRAAILLDQPLPHDARLFASVDDALAINYLVDIWGFRPDLKTLNSRDADDDLSDGQPVFASVDATPALLAELTTPVSLDGFSPDWLLLSTNRQATSGSEVPLHTITPDLLLMQFATSPSPSGNPPSTKAMAGLDVMLTWQLPNGTWPQDLAISLRPTYQGMPLVDPTTGQPIQQDRKGPLFGLWEDSEDTGLTNGITIHDPYRLPLPASLPNGADGLLLILYTQTASGFTNVAEIQIPIGKP